MRYIYIEIKSYFIIYMLFCACGKLDVKKNVEIISSNKTRLVTFEKLINLTNNTVADNISNDSLAFLILPIQASCPSCRKKTIDSIVKHRNTLLDRHYIIISSHGGRKTVNSYFLEQRSELPTIKNKLFLDSTNQAFHYDLYDNKPTIYYTYRRQAYKKVAVIPATVRQDLQEFFSGNKSSLY